MTAGGLSKLGNLQEQFAPAQFRNMDDADKLSQPAYVPQDSGIELAVTGIAYASGTAITRTVRYDVTIIDTKLLRAFSKFFAFAGVFFSHFLRGASVARCELSAFRKAQTNPYGDTVTVAPETFAVALQIRQHALSAPTPPPSPVRRPPTTTSPARWPAIPSLDGTLHVLPQFEMAA